MAISSLGLGSGLDLAGLVSSLVAAERDPVLKSLDIKKSNFDTELSAYSALKGALATFKEAVRSVNTLQDFQIRTVTSSDVTTFTATGSPSAAAGTHAVEISRLASSHALKSNGTFTSPTSNTLDGATGTLNFRFGTYTYNAGGSPTGFTANVQKASASVVINSSNNTLTGIRDAVNGANMGITASIITTGQDASGNSLHQLVFTSKDTGRANAVELTVSGDTVGDQVDNTGLSRLVYSTTAQNMADPQAGAAGQTGSAQDAAFTVNGIGFTSASNTVANAVEGVTMVLKKITAVGSPQSLSVAVDKATVSKNIDTLVKSYNAVLSMIQSVAGYDAEAQQAAILNGDFAVRSVGDQLRQLISAPVAGASGAFTALSQLGIKTGSGGVLSVDTAKLNAAMNSNFDDIAQLFGINGNPSDSLINFDSVTDDVKAGDYAINITQLATQGSLTAGSAISSLVVDANNDLLRVQIDGVSSGDIQITQGTYLTNADLAAQIQSRINGDSTLRNAGVTASVTVNGSNQLVISSTRYGSASAANITSVDTNTTATLGLSIATGTTGVNVAGTINGNSATGTGRYLKSDLGNSKGLRIEVVGGTTGARGTVNFTRGVADKLDTVLDNFLSKTGAISGREAGLKESLKDNLQSRKDLDKRIASLQTRLTRQFVGLDTLLSQLQTTSNYLATQLEGLNNLANSSGKK